MRLTTCDCCSGSIVGEPWITTHRGSYYFTCSAICRSRLEADLKREDAHQRCLELGLALVNGA